MRQRRHDVADAGRRDIQRGLSKHGPGLLPVPTLLLNTGFALSSLIVVVWRRAMPNPGSPAQCASTGDALDPPTLDWRQTTRNITTGVANSDPKIWRGRRDHELTSNFPPSNSSQGTLVTAQDCSLSCRTPYRF
jgi:hypothetical protein